MHRLDAPGSAAPGPKDAGHAAQRLHPQKLTGGAGHMRMNLASSRQIVELALNNMAEAVAEA